MFVGEEKHWDEAQADCWGMGGELLSIKNMETMNYIKKKLYSKELGWSNNGVWNGASNLRDRGWEWTTGMLYEPRCEKTGLRNFRPGPTQTRLYNYRRWLEA